MFDSLAGLELKLRKQSLPPSDIQTDSHNSVFLQKACNTHTHVEEQSILTSFDSLQMALYKKAFVIICAYFSRSCKSETFKEPGA